METAYKNADAETLAAAKDYTDDEITKLNESLTTTGGNVGALTNSLNALTTRVTTNETDIAGLTQTVTDNKAAAEQAIKTLTEGAVTTNANNIANNAAAIETLTQTVATNKSAAEKAVTDLANGQVATNAAAIEILNGNGEGSVAKSIADAITQYGTDATAEHERLEAKIDGNTTNITNLTQTVADNKAAAEKAVTDLANGQVTTNKNDIATLMADAQTSGSVENTVQGYAIPKPSESDCDAASGLCVLSVSSDGLTLKWVDVTDTVASGEGGQEG
jgi:chromosome segregation ATPase